MAFEQAKAELERLSQRLGKPLASHRGAAPPKPAERAMAAATTLGRKRDRASGTTARRRVAGGLGITKLGRPLHERVEIEVIPPLFDFSLGHLEHTKAWQVDTPFGELSSINAFTKHDVADRD